MEQRVNSQLWECTVLTGKGCYHGVYASRPCARARTGSLVYNTVLRVQARLSRFQGANAISSADFYDNGEGGGGGPGPARAGSDFDITAGDLVNRLSMQVGAAAGCHNPRDTDCCLSIVFETTPHGSVQ